MSPDANLSFAAPLAATALSGQFASFADPLTQFEDGSARLTDGARANLKSQADWLVSHPEVRVRLIAGADAQNRNLAAHRARVVEAMLLDGGVDRSRIRLTIAGELATEGDLKMSRVVLTEIILKDVSSAGAVLATAVTPASVSVPVTDPAPAAQTPLATPSPAPNSEPAPSPKPEAPTAEPAPEPEPVAPNKKPKRPNSGKGNGGEDGDPGNSGDHNNAGDD